MPPLLLTALFACFHADSDPVDTAADLTAFEPDPTRCLRAELEANQPERLYLPGGKAKLCLGRWKPDQHCYGGPPLEEDTLMLDFAPWAARYDFEPGARQDYFVRLTDSAAQEDERDRSLYNADLGLCIVMFDAATFANDSYNPWTWEQWQGVAPDCTVDNMLRCTCDADGQPTDPSCYDLNIP